MVETPPELTNADLELLFTQLLEGVHQARGQQWALKYLQRMENRITVERWLDWLLMFGEKLLASPAPNHQLATRMVQLGELGIGKIGELAYDIGIQVLRRNSRKDYGDEELELLVESTEPTENLLDSPGQELLRKWGDHLWHDEEEEIATITPAPQVFEEKLTDNSEAVEFFAPVEADEVNSEAVEFFAPVEADEVSDLGELIWEDDPEEVETATTILTPSASTAEETSDQLLVNLEPKVASALDELLVRLDQSANLVQQLASELAIQKSDAAPPANSDRQIVISQPTALVNATTQAQTWFYKGLQQAKAGDLLGAIANYDQAIEFQPDVYEYWFNRGLALFHLEYFAEAITNYDQAIELKPDFYKAWYLRGGILGALGNFEEAIASFDKAIDIKPDYPAAWSNRGLALLKLGLLWEAISSYDQALNLQPQDPENWYYRGVALAVDEQYPEAIASYDRALLIQPDYLDVWIDRGVVLFNLGRWSEAIDSWDKALSIQPELYLAWYNRGIALDNLGRREEAIASYQQAIAIKPDFHFAWYNQAVALFYLERFVEAIASYDSALQIKIDYWEAWMGRGTAAGNLVNPDPSESLITRTSNPALNLRGYEGKLASYEEGLTHLRPDTHPEGWGRLHLAIANTHYDQGKKHSTPRDYWGQAIAEYDQALLTLTPEDFPQLHLEVLQSLIKVLIALGYTAPAEELQQSGIDLWRQLLNEPTRPDETKKQLALKFAGLGQLAVDLAVDAGDLVEAWEIAEQGKNTCSTWLLSGWRDDIYSPKYNSVQQLLNPTTAIVYWHISPAALHTFIIKDQAPSPILLFTPIQDLGAIMPLAQTTNSLNELPLPEAVQRLIDFENWVEDWHQEYQEYRHQDQETKSDHSWRVDMENRLENLKNILNISTIAQELEGITQLILIPHRDLYRLPVHALFNIFRPCQEELPDLELNCTITYLPSIQRGVFRKTNSLSSWSQQQLLSVEQPNDTGSTAPKFTRFASEIVSQMFDNPQRIQGLQATKNNVENALFTNYNIFNFTGHSINNFSEPKKSELALVNEDKLILEEIYQHTLASYNLVTLWACENLSTSNHNINSEYVGLATGFLSGGVPHVVSTIWTVESSATALVMIEFYRRLQPNKSAVTALAEATAWLKDLTAVELTKWYENLLNILQPEDFRTRAYLATQMYRSSKLEPEQKLYNHPYYWAAFTVSGNIISR
nr:tetratricopeptide repeat protein [Cylindrospermum sp. FACHB-282]